MEGCLPLLSLVAAIVAVAAYLRIRNLESHVGELRYRLDEMAAGKPAQAVPRAPAAARDEAAAAPEAVAAAPEKVATAEVAAPAAAPPPAEEAVPKPPPKELVHPPERPPAPARPPVHPPAPAVAAVVEPPPSRERPTAAREFDLRKWLNLEELLGTQVFLKVGVAIVVIGMVFFLGYALKSLEALGRVIVGYLVAAGMLAGGLAAERRESYRAFGRALLAGGWSIVYFVTFAMHFIPAARIVDSRVVAIVALLAAAASAVGFSLRYRNEWTTTASFLLIFLALAISAVELDTTFNLAAATVVAVALSLLAYRLGWDRMLALGVPATWAVMAIWLLPHAASLEPQGGSALSLSILGALAATWSVFQLPLLVRPGAAADARWQVAAEVANLAGFGLALVYVRAAAPGWDWLAALLFGAAYLATSVRFARLDRRPLYLLSATVGLTLLALAAALYLGLGSHWLPLFWLLEVELVLAGGVLLRERYFRLLAYGAFIVVVIDLVRLSGAIADEIRLPFMLAGTLVSLANVYLLRTRWRPALAGREELSAATLFSVSATLLLALLLWRQLPDAWIAPALAAAGLLWIAAACRFTLRDFFLEGCGLLVAALAALEPVPSAGVSAASAALTPLATAISCYLAYALLRRFEDRWDASLRAWLPRAGTLSSVAGLLAVVLLVLDSVPGAWQAPAFMALVAVHFALALKNRWPELLVEGLVVTVLGLFVLVTTSWQLEGLLLGVPARSLSVLAAAAPLYLAHLLARRRAVAEPDLEAPILPGVRRLELGAITFIYLALPTVIVSWLVKSEALAYQKNLLVALLWGLMGVLYLELARKLPSRLWNLHGHALLAAATVHLFLVNFLQTGSIGPVSLRLLTVLPFLAMLAYVYSTWKGLMARARIPDRIRELGCVYLYAIVTVVATLLLYEMPRSQVVVWWAVLAVALLVIGRDGENVHWRISAAAMAVATALRGIGANLYLRDEVLDLRTNLVTLPLACLVLLAAYFLVRRPELQDGDPGRGGDPIGRLTGSRTWLLSVLALLTGFIVVETSGTALTIWLSIEGLAVVALGFVQRERLARLIGLFLLSFCILKIFFYDLRGLSGLARVGSFVVLGFVLIAVSWAYTRFRERLKEII